MTDDEREALASWLNREAYATPQARAIVAQLRAGGERIKALEAALRGLIGLYDDPSLPSGLEYQDEIDRRLRLARDVLKDTGND